MESRDDLPPRHDFPSALSARGKTDVTVLLQNDAARLLLRALAPAEESGAGRVLEHLPNSLPSSSRALEVLLGANLLCHSHALRVSESEPHPASSAAVTYLLRCHWPLVRLPQLINHPRIASEILLAGDQDYREAGAEVHNLRDPLHNHVSQQNHPVGRAARTFS